MTVDLVAHTVHTPSSVVPTGSGKSELPRQLGAGNAQPTHPGRELLLVDFCVPRLLPSVISSCTWSASSPISTNEPPTVRCSLRAEPPRSGEAPRRGGRQVGGRPG
jgi:hypothetical protein